MSSASASLRTNPPRLAERLGEALGAQTEAQTDQELLLLRYVTHDALAVTSANVTKHLTSLLGAIAPSVSPSTLSKHSEILDDAETDVQGHIADLQSIDEVQRMLSICRSEGRLVHDLPGLIDQYTQLETTAKARWAAEGGPLDLAAAANDLLGSALGASHVVMTTRRSSAGSDGAAHEEWLPLGYEFVASEPETVYTIRSLDISVEELQKLKSQSLQRQRIRSALLSSKD